MTPQQKEANAQIDRAMSAYDSKIKDAANMQLLDDNTRLRALVRELAGALGLNAERLEAWAEGERAAQISAEQRQDRPSAETHWNAVKNYAALAKQARDAEAKARGVAP